MLKPNCPHCHKKVLLLSNQWRSQRSAPKTVCPFCGSAVVVKFRASTYSLWFILVAGAGSLAFLLFGIHAASVFFPAAFLVPLLPSMYLENAA